MVRFVGLFISGHVLLTLFFFPQPAAAAACEGLAAQTLSNTTITLAETVAAGAFAAPQGGGRGEGGAGFRNLPAFCRVAATLKPSSDSDIRIEVWMPVSGWNGRLQSAGNGAWAGTISYPAMATALAAGYAAASTDTGHIGNTATFAHGHPEKVIDFAYRSVHEMTVAAKALIAAYYGNGPQYSYWNGCSTGGRQATAEAQRFPDDYDGILAGAIVNYPTRQQGTQVWTGIMGRKDNASIIPASKYSLLHDAVIQACDALDGVKDGVLENPMQCRFDPKVLQCNQGDAPSCLTAAQVDVVQKMYAGPKDSHGKSIYPGAAPGSELGWPARIDQPPDLAIDTYKYLVFKEPNWDYTSFNAEKDMAVAEKVIGPVMDNVDPNLKPFFDRGGKLLLYHGWNDAGVSPFNSINYYESVVERLGGTAKTADSIRLFMIPGMGHCRGGDGTDTFDGIAALAQWVEKGKAPDQIRASRVRNGGADRTRPLCPYRQTAAYKGAGSTDDAANFVCKSQ